MGSPKMFPVSSSNIAALGYDEQKEEAYVKFNSGATYAYKDVSQEQFDELKNADSIGSFLNKVFKNSHAAEKVSG